MNFVKLIYGIIEVDTHRHNLPCLLGNSNLHTIVLWFGLTCYMWGAEICDGMWQVICFVYILDFQGFQLYRSVAYLLLQDLTTTERRWRSNKQQEREIYRRGMKPCSEGNWIFCKQNLNWQGPGWFIKGLLMWQHYLHKFSAVLSFQFLAQIQWSWS